MIYTMKFFAIMASSAAELECTASASQPALTSVTLMIQFQCNSPRNASHRIVSV